MGGARSDDAVSLLCMAPPAIRVDERLWEKAAELRRREWRALIAELSDVGALFEGRSASLLVIDLDDQHLRLFLHAEAGVTNVEVPRREIAHLIDEYRGVITMLGDEGNSIARMEALDMAKKVVHDDGARRIAAILPDLSPEHETRRRFFTLVVSLAVDTTKMPWARRHL